MRNIMLTVQYDGTNYSGWQSQKNSLAVQDLIERSLAKVTGEKSRIIGATRTDAGVHALGQVANFKTQSDLPLLNIKNGINRNLPRDIVITRISVASPDFHSQYDAKRKHYRYYISTGRPVSPFLRNYITDVRYKLNFDVIKRESRVLLGRHNFSSFQGSNSKRESAVRSIYRIELRKKGRIAYFDIEADGFLYTMARTIVGTLIDIGRGYLKAGDLKKILEAGDRSVAGPTAPAKGLFLMKVRY